MYKIVADSGSNVKCAFKTTKTFDEDYNEVMANMLDKIDLNEKRSQLDNDESERTDTVDFKS